MRTNFLLTFFLSLACVSYSQSNDVNLAAIAWEKGLFENAWENANSALQSPQGLDKSLLNKAYCIRGKAGTRISYTTLTGGSKSDIKLGMKDVEVKAAIGNPQNVNTTVTKYGKSEQWVYEHDYYLYFEDGVLTSWQGSSEGENDDPVKYSEMALRAYYDFKEVLNTKDTVFIKDISPEFYKLGHALLLSGTDYDALNADKEKIDSSLIDKSIECYSAAIELWSLAKREKYKPFYYRGDAWLAKKQYNKAVDDFEKAMSMFIAATRKLPDLGIGDLGYRLAYTQASVFNNKAVALKTIEKTRELLEAEMQLAESKKEKIAEQYEDLKTQYDYLIGELNSLKTSVTK